MRLPPASRGLYNGGKRFTNLQTRALSRMASALSHRRAPAASSPWELAAETIAVKIRWFGLLVGYILVNLNGVDRGRQAVLNAILTVGLAYTLFDTYFSVRGRVFFGRSPL